MAMNVTQDQNFSAHFDGVETRGSSIQKNRGGGLEGKKAPNDISNSGKPPAINTSRKQNPKTVIPIGEDVGVPKKALVDLTDSVKPITPLQSLTNQSLENISIPPCEDRFHNHDECIKMEQQEAWDLEPENFWRSHSDLSMYPDLKEIFDMEDMIEAKGSPSPPSPLKIEHLFDPFLDSP